MSYLIDPSCYENVCSGNENVTENNFSSQTDDEYLYVYTIYIIFIILKILIIYNIPSCNKKRYFLVKKILFITTFINSIILTIYSVHYLLTININICSYNDFCYIKNDTVLSDKYYYKLINDECPNYSELVYRYTDFYEENRETDSNYGICQLNIQCEITMYYNYSSEHYSKLLKYDRGMIDYNVFKKDKEGSNCPDIVNIILKVTRIHNIQIYSDMFLHIGIDILFTLVIICVACMCIKDEHKLLKVNESASV